MSKRGLVRPGEIMFPRLFQESHIVISLKFHMDIYFWRNNKYPFNGGTMVMLRPCIGERDRRERIVTERTCMKTE